MESILNNIISESKKDDLKELRKYRQDERKKLFERFKKGDKVD